ncbi:centrosomal protein CEP57L1 isoform X2 [Heteronotia binoei]|uniref:centrosomal protein CEP57L1 isoform X2 n=1 Tax=Heteronotia binoei TaxID=13085 RepID=UPI00292F23EE|nr:centrosomal protein CEP57L1 isoform X2 [Heteronotia binoei]XP_060093960.1 centrosomal protein CEP57L1 isoform X2 [Heteronotia binoei]XP_060093968.1 centrosomal protein CEP57L1 isoform X2 [Heteronotia binoei]
MESLDIESKHSYIGSFIQPPHKISIPFADLWPKKTTAVTADTPAPNSQALLSALKSLQEKIHRLELERSQAEDDLNCLSREAAQYKKTLQHESNEKDIVHQKLMQDRKDVSVQLSAAQSRCSLLEKQLDYMRKMVTSAELEKKLVVEQQSQLQKEKDQNQAEICAKLDKLEILEKECWRLTGTQKAAEEKIKHLEARLQEEQHHRKLIQDKAAQLQTGLEMNRILMTSLSPQKEAKKKSGKKKAVKKNSSLKKECSSQPHLAAGALPFVAGKSASSSHSVAANVQSVLHMMKSRGPHLIPQGPEGAEKRISRWTGVCRSGSFCSTSSATDNLSDLLLIMQDELGQMSFEHQELLKQIQETKNHEVREDLERELECLVKQMEIKGEQITKLKRHQESVYKLKQKAQKLKRKAANVTSKPDDCKGTKEVTVPPRSSVHGTCSVNKSTNSLQLLRSAQKIQSVLKKDDILWEP